MNSPDTTPNGPRVFLDYDQAALDAAYNQAVYAPHAGNVRKRFIIESDAVLTLSTTLGITNIAFSVALYANFNDNKVKCQALSRPEGQIVYRTVILPDL